MREILESKYNALLQKYGFKSRNQEHQLGNILKQILRQFIDTHKNVALYGYDEKSRALMGLIIFELRSIKIIIDNDVDRLNESGYTLISEDKIGDYDIDGIIIFKSETGGGYSKKVTRKLSFH